MSTLVLAKYRTIITAASHRLPGGAELHIQRSNAFQVVGRTTESINSPSDRVRFSFDIERGDNGYDC